MKLIHTLVSFTLGDTNAINHLILSKHRVNWDRLFQVFPSPFNFVFDGSSIELDLHNVCLLLTLLEQLHLCVSNDSHNSAVADHFLEVLLNGLAAKFVLPFLARLSKCLLLALVPVVNHTVQEL